MAVINLQNRDEYLFSFEHAVVKGRAPRSLDILAKAKIKIYDTVAKIHIYFLKFPLENLSYYEKVFSKTNQMVDNAPFFTAISFIKLKPNPHLTRAQRNFQSWDEKTKNHKFTNVKDVEYFGFVQKDLALSQQDEFRMIQIMENQLALCFPNVPSIESESESHLSRFEG